MRAATNYLAEYPGFRILKDHPVVEPLVSILVRVKNEARAIGPFLESLQRQDIFPRTEVIMLDSGSTDGTLEALLEFPASVCAIRPEEFSFGPTCNLVCSLTSAPILSLMSGHIVLCVDDLLSKACAAFDGKSVLTAAYVRQVQNPQLGCSAYERAYLRRRFPPGPSEIRMPAGGHAFSNAASFFTAESWRAIPFPDMKASEDYFWAESLMAAGGSVFYLPFLNVAHSHNETPVDLRKRVTLNVRARNLAGSRLAAAKYLIGVTGACLLEGAGPWEALQYGWAHARSYLSR